MHHLFEETLTSVRRNHSVDAGHNDLEKSDKFAVVFRTNVERTNLRKTFESDISEIRNLEELEKVVNNAKERAWVKSTYSRDENINDLGLKDITERNPVQESQQCLQSRPDQARLVGLLQNLITQVENLSEFCAHSLFQGLCLCLRHLLGRKVEYFFRQETKNDHVVFAKGEVSAG